MTSRCDTIIHENHRLGEGVDPKLMGATTNTIPHIVSTRSYYPPSTPTSYTTQPRYFHRSDASKGDRYPRKNTTVESAVEFSVIQGPAQVSESGQNIGHTSRLLYQVKGVPFVGAFALESECRIHFTVLGAVSTRRNSPQPSCSHSDPHDSNPPLHATSRLFVQWVESEAAVSHPSKI